MQKDLVREAIEDIGHAFQEFKSANGQRLDAITDRLEELEARASSPALGAGNRKGMSAADREHMQRFDAWLRRPNDAHTKNELSEFENRERKAMSVASAADGGFAVPEQILREIERLELKMSPVRQLVKVIQVGTGDVKHLVNTRGATSGWVGEAGPRTETDTPQLRERAPTMGEIYAYPQVSEWALDDVFFDLGGWLAEEVAESFAINEGDAVIRGDGTNKPTGMLKETPAATADFASPARDPAAYQYIESSAGSPAVAAITGDALIDLLYSVDARYRVNGAWIMNSATAATVRKLKDENGQYLWAQGLIAGQPDRLLGHPVSIWEQLDDVGANNFPIAFGDWRRAYLLADRTQLRITVDSNITTPGKIKYFVRRREGGCVLNNHAAKWLRTVSA